MCNARTSTTPHGGLLSHVYGHLMRFVLGIAWGDVAACGGQVAPSQPVAGATCLDVYRGQSKR